MSALTLLAEQLRASAGIAHKRDIDQVVASLKPAAAPGVPVGDDCAAIADGDGFLLFAIEGFINEFVAAEPWFAGYCGVMVNVSDIYAMGGRPVAVVDALWSRSGAAAYGVPIVGGHSNRRSEREQLSVAIIGRARHLLTSFDARPGQHLVLAIDLRGHYHEPYNYWNASTDAPPQRLRDDLELLPSIAEDGLCAAAKDVSMAGVVGTALMLLECSGVGATIDLDAVPRPPAVPLERWLATFPSYGFLLSVADADLDAVRRRFAARGLACEAIGKIDASRQLHLALGGERTLFWDLREEALIGCAPETMEATHA
jgi:AIR synthase-related protein